MSPLNAVATTNILDILVTFVTCHLDKSLLNAYARRNIPSMFVTRETSQLLRLLSHGATLPHPSNISASWNVESMEVTLEVTHFERSPLNFVASLNRVFMFVTLEVSHSPMIPFVSVPATVGQVPSGVSSKQAFIFAASSARVFGVNMAAVWSVNQNNSKEQSRQMLP